MVRDGLCDIIEYLNIESVSSIHTAIDGNDALDKIKLYEPDIVITDLNMPNMDGLTLIQHIVAHSLKIKLIVISGYDEFHMVKESFKLGITDYLLKPVHTEELRKALLNSITSLQEDKLKQTLGEVEKSQAWIEHASRQLNMLLANHDADAAQYEAMFENEGIVMPYDQVMVAIITVLEKQSESVSWQMKLAIDMVNDSYADGEFKIYPLFNMANDLVLWISYNKLPDMKAFVQHIKAQYSKSMFIVACGRAYAMKGYLKEAYQSSYEVLRYKVVSRAFSILDESIYTKRNMHHMDATDIKRLVHMVEYGQKDEVQGFIQHYFNDERLGTYTFEAIEEMYETIMRIIQWLPSKKRSIYSFDQPEQLRIYLKACIFQTIEARKEILSSHNMVEVAKRYVQEHLLDEINMAVVANYCNVSYHHFSKLFKEGVGINFQDYVTQSRMEYAKRALEGLNVKIIDVASQLGYNNPKNFTRVFKNYFGITPRDYQESLHIK